MKALLICKSKQKVMSEWQKRSDRIGSAQLSREERKARFGEDRQYRKESTEQDTVELWRACGRAERESRAAQREKEAVFPGEFYRDRLRENKLDAGKDRKSKRRRVSRTMRKDC